MSTSAPNDAEAFEYVLALSSKEDRRETELALLNDPDLAREVWQLEEALSDLSHAPPAKRPSKRVWRAVEASTFGTAGAGRGTSRSGIAFWRGLASLSATAAVAAFALVAVLVLRPDAILGTPEPFVAAIVAEDGGITLVRVAVDGTLHAEAFNGAIAAENDPELWVIEDGKDPISVGVLGKTGPFRVSVSDYDLSGARLVVTSEPLGGSPNEGPTGPAIAAGDLKRI